MSLKTNVVFNVRWGVDMYRMQTKEDYIRIPPERLSEDIEEIIESLAKENYEGKVDNEGNIILVVQKVVPVGDGIIVHGDGGVYQKVKFDCVVYYPELHEVINGVVVDVMKFGAFVRFGPLDGLLHISQILDDHITVDLKNERLVGKDTKRDLRRGDKVRARIVAVSINERNPRDSKIGLTMRQPGLGKLEWIEEDRKPKEEPKKKKEKKKKSKRK